MDNLAELLTHADRRTLAAVVVQLSGDPQAVPDLGNRAQIEAAALSILGPFLSGEAAVTPPTDEVALAAMRLATASRVNTNVVSEDYIPIMREITALGPEPATQSFTAPSDFSVVIIGAGVTGLLAGYRLLQAGFRNFRIIEEAAEVGGTWTINRYPGARVDTPSMLYSYNFWQDPGWSEHFCPQPELLSYMKSVAREYGLEPFITTSTSVTEMRWDEATSRWILDVRFQDGTIETLTANFVISAVGLLRVPRIPDIPGIAQFRKPAFHSTSWTDTVDVRGKHLAVVGSGATAIQIVPAIADSVSRITVFERTPHWIQPHPDYGKKLSGAEHELFEIPTYRQWYRFRQFWRFGDSAYNTVRVDPEWPHQDRSVSAENEVYRQRLVDYMNSQVGERPELIQKILPKYPPWGKRMLIDNGWFKTLLRPNVSLIDDPIQAFTEDAIVTTREEIRPDLVVFATGFHADRAVWPIKITGSDGVDVSAKLNAEPEAYLGLVLEDAPNLIVTSGPFGSPGHGGNGFFNAEWQVHYAIACIKQMAEEGISSLQVRPEAVRKFVDHTTADLQNTVFTLPGVSNWFKGSRGRVTAVMWRRLAEIWQMTREPVLEDYLLVRDSRA